MAPAVQRRVRRAGGRRRRDGAARAGVEVRLVDVELMAVDVPL